MTKSWSCWPLAERVRRTWPPWRTYISGWSHLLNLRLNKKRWPARYEENKDSFFMLQGRGNTTLLIPLIFSIKYLQKQKGVSLIENTYLSIYNFGWIILCIFSLTLRFLRSEATQWSILASITDKEPSVYTLFWPSRSFGYESFNL